MTDNRDTWIAEASVKLDDAISHLEKAAPRRTWAIPLRHTSPPRCWHLSEAKSKLRGDL
jgi:hypothetical protein